MKRSWRETFEAEISARLFCAEQGDLHLGLAHLRFANSHENGIARFKWERVINANFANLRQRGKKQVKY